jgi:hypothetical protein
LSSWRIVIGCFGSRVCIAAPAPPTHTRCPFHDGMYWCTGSFSWKRPSSYSIIKATDVMGLLIE